MNIVIASHNAHKVREIRAICRNLPFTFVSLADVPPLPPVIEDGDTFEANARKKAIEVAGATGGLALADDSGIEVDALGGAPGVRSARWAGRDGDDAANNAKLVASLRGVAAERRTARYRCVIVVAEPGRVLFTAEGSCDGVVALTPRGDGGFGYDPYVFLPELGRTMAELEPDVKNRVSHRARALASCRDKLAELARARRGSG